MHVHLLNFLNGMCVAPGSETYFPVEGCLQVHQELQRAHQEPGWGGLLFPTLAEASDNTAAQTPVPLGGSRDGQPASTGISWQAAMAGTDHRVKTPH